VCYVRCSDNSYRFFVGQAGSFWAISRPTGACSSLPLATSGARPAVPPVLVWSRALVRVRLSSGLPCLLPLSSGFISRAYICGPAGGSVAALV
jgi:hypothetical protein